MNDIAGIQAKYGKDLVINGGWRTDGPAWCPGASEDLVRSELRECFNAFADDSAYIFWTGGQVGFSEDQAARFGWVTDEARDEQMMLIARLKASDVSAEIVDPYAPVTDAVVRNTVDLAI